MQKIRLIMHRLSSYPPFLFFPTHLPNSSAFFSSAIEVWKNNPLLQWFRDKLKAKWNIVLLNLTGKLIGWKHPEDKTHLFYNMLQKALLVIFPLLPEYIQQLLGYSSAENFQVSRWWAVTQYSYWCISMHHPFTLCDGKSSLTFFHQNLLSTLLCPWA